MNARQTWRAAATALLTVGTAVVVAGPARAAAPLDSQPPTITFGVWRYTAGTVLSDATSAARVPVTITWKQHDPDGIVEQQGYFDDSQGFHDEYSNYPQPGDPPYGSMQTSMPANGSATFSMFSIDCQDNTGQDATTRRSTLVQQAAFGRSGGWRSRADSRSSGGSALVSTAAGASASVRFTGTSFALVTRTGPGGGRARVLVDGHQVTTIDTASATRTDRVLGFQRQFAARGPHTIKVVAVSAAPVTVDAAVSN
jgi:hypothetical protein